MVTSRPYLNVKLRYYVFCDIVGFTKIHPVDEQVKAIDSLTTTVRMAIETIHIDQKQIRFLPTGDGMCAVLPGDADFDTHFKLAKMLLHGSQLDLFPLRVGVGQGTDFSFLDINDQPNFAGNGINSTARAMDAAEANQIVVTEDAFKNVSEHAAYSADRFSRIEKEIKGRNWTFYLYEPKRQ